ncbi:heavy metal-responsive transcriptional regulator [Piscirickettsia salmonis]|uniref:heavy metal-responsive transcriptional regulator n=1 Tax=Piscirickettsia salmonis TaxID=1238 RepID=UPI0007C88638|nr:HTH-type transcriptional regulator CueR [Piscirickettsiaceae bacterium NZ-RLO1]
MTTLARQYTVGQLARLAGVTAVAIRFYEKKGLLPKAQRAANGYRYYHADVLKQLSLINNAKKAGFSLAEVRELIDLSQAEEKTASAVKKQLAEKITEVKEKITALMTIERSLTHLNATCSGQMPASACPIIQKLSSNKTAEGG